MPYTRRQFLKGMGITIGGIGAASMGWGELIPYIHQPDDMIPGVSTWYATSCRECPAGCAMVVRNRESRVVKCEGNPLHPVNRGRLCPRGQAALQGLYDPDRIKGPLTRDRAGSLVGTSWEDALKAVGAALAGARGRIALLTDLQSGSLDALMRAWTASLGSAEPVVYEPIGYQGVKSLYGVVPSIDISKCDYLVSFGADFLENWISPVEYAGQFAEMRKIKDGKRPFFVYVGPRVSMTAVNADVRILVPPEAITEVASAIRSLSGPGVARKYGLEGKVLADVARGFASASSPLVLPGWYSDSAEAASIMGARGLHSVNTARPHALTHVSSSSTVSELISQMRSGEIEALIVHGANPAYSLPESAGFADAIKHVPLVACVSSFMDETAALANCVLPCSSALESWGDYQPYPDVWNLMQPTMGSLFNTRQAGDIFIALAQAAGVDTASVFKAKTFHEYLLGRWKSLGDWETLLRRGGKWAGGIGNDATPVTGYQSLRMEESEAAESREQSAESNQPSHAQTLASLRPPLSALGSQGLRLYAFPQTYLYDGRGANRWWLQETPEPVIKGTYSTWAEIHPSTARRLGIHTDDVIEISAGGAKLEVSAYVWPGVAPDTIAAPIGEGHTEYGRFAKGFGVNVLRLLGAENPPVKVSSTGRKQWATRILGSTDQEGRAIVQTAALGTAFRREEEIIMPLPSGYGPNDFYPGHKYKEHRWAMVVDLDRCIGCHACVAACYAENNLGRVGPDGIYRRREMSWIRIDSYIDWKEPHAPVQFQPMLCQHCDAAPCEPVCPVYAASHSDEGLNMQIYNRCVGTRYCSNNCPYKVRRFNWFDYEWPEPLNYQLNPDVTVRSRGVMEKCTFCIQRIRQAEIVAKRDGRKLSDGDIVPACAQTCPTNVFTFGDLKDPNSAVSRLVNEDPRAYQVLRDLNTKPAVIYLKRVVV